MVAAVIGAGGMGESPNSWSYVTRERSIEGAGTFGAGYKLKAGAPSNDRNGRGCDAQSRYPSEEAKRLK